MENHIIDIFTGRDMKGIVKASLFHFLKIAKICHKMTLNDMFMV